MACIRGCCECALHGCRYCGSNEAAGPDDSAGYKEYDRSVCLQMVGRAGRPQFDTEGVAVIMTQKEVREARIWPRTMDHVTC